MDASLDRKAWQVLSYIHSYWYFCEHYLRDKTPLGDPFDLADLPVNLIKRITQKLDVAEFVELSSASSQIEKICAESPPYCEFASIEISQFEMKVNGVGTKIEEWPFLTYGDASFKFEEVTCRINCLIAITKSSISRQRFLDVIKLFKKSQTKCFTFEIKAIFQPQIRPEEMEEMIETLSAKVFICHSMIENNYLTPSFLDNLKLISLRNTTIDDTIFLSFNHNDIYLKIFSDFITPYAINQAFKEWKSGERPFFALEIIPKNHLFEEDDYKRILSGLNANIIWTLDQHENSFVGEAIKKEFCHLFVIPGTEFYSIIDSSNIKRVLFVALSRTCAYAQSFKADDSCNEMIMFFFQIVTLLPPLFREYIFKGFLVSDNPIIQYVLDIHSRSEIIQTEELHTIIARAFLRQFFGEYQPLFDRAF